MRQDGAFKLQQRHAYGLAQKVIFPFNASNKISYYNTKVFGFVNKIFVFDPMTGLSFLTWTVFVMVLHFFVV